MRKLLYYIPVLLLLAIACTKEEVAPINTVNAIGLVKIQQASYFQYGTHILTTEQGIVLYALKSESLNLDTYLDEEVEISGIPVAGYPLEGGPEFLEVVAARRQN
ncbi:hypothetical protein ACMA1I_18100 [Pontibacter sp. 13R65]|uniref:hypothetical protein n=1 Tax=Pontibacter sp. 13R65 TaxID=3127458 RepID=UPI00301B9784